MEIESYIKQGKCYTPCPHGETTLHGFIPKVGSIACKLCEHFVSEKNGIITCNKELAHHE